MPRSIVRIAVQKTKVRTVVKGFFWKPMNSVLVAVLVIGIILLFVASSIHPNEVSILSQTEKYSVSSTLTNQTAFTLFSDKTTFLKFTMPQNEKVNYSLMSEVIIRNTDATTYPGAIKIVWQSIYNGTAQGGQVVAVPPIKNNPYAIATHLGIYSLTGGTYNVSIESYSYYNSTLNFSPNYAIAGLGLTIVSATVIASAAGIKVEEF